jgi:hypothetical protein
MKNLIWAAIGAFLAAGFFGGGALRFSRGDLSFHHRPFDVEDAFVGFGLAVVAVIAIYAVIEAATVVRDWLYGGPPWAK